MVGFQMDIHGSNRMEDEESGVAYEPGVLYFSQKRVKVYLSQ